MQTDLSARFRSQAWFYLVVGALPFFTWFAVNWLFWLLSLFAIMILMPAVYIIAVAFTVRCMIAAGRGAHPGQSHWERVPAILTPPAVLAVCAALFAPAARAGSICGDWAYLMMNRAAYQQVIAAANSRKLASAGTVDGVVYQFDDDPPLRVAFKGEGFLDNWSGIVYDPTGAVMLADGFDPVTGMFRAPDRITKLFGGDLVGCRPIQRPYYRCDFT